EGDTERHHWRHKQNHGPLTKHDRRRTDERRRLPSTPSAAAASAAAGEATAGEAAAREAAPLRAERERRCGPRAIRAGRNVRDELSSLLDVAVDDFGRLPSGDAQPQADGLQLLVHVLPDAAGTLRSLQGTEEC